MSNSKSAEEKANGLFKSPNRLKSGSRVHSSPAEFKLQYSCDEDKSNQNFSSKKLGDTTNDDEDVAIQKINEMQQMQQRKKESMNQKHETLKLKIVQLENENKHLLK